MSKPTVNSWNDGMNLNMSDMVIGPSMSRLAQNMRIIDLDSATFALSNIRGTEQKFQLTNGFVPLSSEEYNNTLYILSFNPASSECELGTFPSPDYSGGSNNMVYRPLNNLSSGVFRTSVFGYNIESIVKMVLQPDYDESINIILFSKGKTPRIINSKFKFTGGSYLVTDARPGNANSNTYTTASVDKETYLQVFSDKILKLAFGGVQSGGRVKPGNYQYVFYYMTEDFNRTEIIGQSSTVQLSFGTSANTVRGGISTEETNKKVAFTLSNIDTDFKYIKVYMLYSSGFDGLEQQYLEFVNPITITGEIMTFSHTGFETLREVSQDSINTTYYGLESANTGEQINGYLLVGGVQERQVSLNDLATGAQAMVPQAATKELVPTSTPGYADPNNVYHFMGNFGGESYPYAVVYVLPGGVLSPAFPTKGKVFTAATDGSDTISSADQSNGIVTFWDSNVHLPYKNNKEQVKHIRFDVSAVPQEVKDASLGFFIVRGERRPWLLTQGMLIPTCRVAPTAYLHGGSDTPYYYDAFQAGDENSYRLVPCLDQLMEAFALDELGTSEDPVYAVDEFFQISGGYMPIIINDLKVAYGSGQVENMPTDRWAFYAGDSLLNEPSYITNLQREAPYLLQIAKAQFRVGGAVAPLYHQDSGSMVLPSVGLHYALESYSRYLAAAYKKCTSMEYIPGETFATGSDFVSEVEHRFKLDGGESAHSFDVKMKFNAYFGVKTIDALIDATKGATNPIGGNSRITGGTRTTDNAQTSGVKYSNNGSLVPGGFLVNVYSSNVKPTGIQLYPSTDDIIYRQVTPRYTWSEVATAGNVIDVFGGDAYICKVSRKLNQSGFRNPTAVGSGENRRANMDQGIMITWWQESKYNLYLRYPYQFDASETQKRSFFPHQSAGDFTKYRSYRFPETVISSPGYSELLAPKSFIPAPSLSPTIRNNFFSRVAASARHIPNAFRNGYRTYLSTAFKDYDAGMGEIIEMFNFRNELIVIFEHGVGALSIEDRVLTGRDSAGPVYAEPSSVLPTNMKFYSRKVGAQNAKAVIRTMGAIYGMDQDKKVIWQLTDALRSVSDETVSSFLEQNSMPHPRCGYNLKYKEVVFSSDYWTLVFREGANKFASFYNYKMPFYASRGNEFYSSDSGRFYLHDANTRLIFGEEQDCFVEFVVNADIADTKVFDTIQLISNEVRPSKIEFFAYGEESKRLLTIVPEGCQQYSKVQDQIDPISEINEIPYVDKKFVIKIPKTEIYNGQLDDWEIGGRMRNNKMIVRITYNTDKQVQLMGAITTYRISPG